MNTILKSLIILAMISGSLLLLAVSCKKESDEADTVTDIDGNVYKTVVIGTQTWLAENLKTTKYSNGNEIGTTTPATKIFAGVATPRYQWSYNFSESNVASYGRLYTWYVVNDSRGICPAGWQVPSDAEWKALTSSLGGAFYPIGYEGNF